MTTSNKNAKGHKRIGAVLGLALVSSVVGLSAMTSSAEAHGPSGIKVCEDRWTGKLYNCNKISDSFRGINLNNQNKS
ncbi:MULTISPECIES: hypothetical protein [unclassified Prochlorococcus]|uniref:hypothetical protein n=1 Tax=unclassified Prochlorococcus TaxID=2627481 RepID=UPI000533A6F4|nr:MULTISPECIES: hypothetical protein [unclassified Prochlorococcus]KGG14987.1 hypothetical protein EV06_1501 [Prochlorococcus sp. MIT 0602]KGG17175.1 hypothetical protein EV07_0610 [Prochlorococcus sp. MIT 0603]